MDWQKLIERLQETGLTQQQIAERVGITQPSVSALLRGEAKNPKYSVGQALVELHDSLVA